jgi:hypothetical protein
LFVRHPRPSHFIAATITSLALSASLITTSTAQGEAPRPKAPVLSVAAAERYIDAHAPRAIHLVSSEQMREWSRVALCEESGNWHVVGPRYSGGLGITNRNWIEYGGLQFAPNAGLATAEQQVAIALRIQRYAPDQYGCTGAW